MDTNGSKPNMVNSEIADLKAIRNMEEGDDDGGDNMDASWRKGYDKKNNPFCCVVRYLQTVKEFPGIALMSLFLFVALCVIGLTVIYVVRDNNIDDSKEESFKLARETADFFSDELEKSFFPLLTLAQFMKETKIFHNLTEAIGSANEEGSAPFRSPVHRNVTGICDDPDLITRYEEIASVIKRNAQMPGVLVNLQVVPQGVICLNYPVINTEDFEEGTVLDNTGAFGLDLGALPHVKPFIQDTLAHDEQEVYVSVQGPITLTQCADCPPAVRQAFLARTVVQIPSLQSQVGDEVYPDRWGVAAVLLNWGELVVRSGMYEAFGARGLDFQLTKMEHVDEENREAVVLAETPGFHNHENSNMRTVSVSLDTTQSEWEMTVAYPLDDEWVGYAIAALVVFSLCIALLLMELMVQRQRYKNMEQKYADDVARPQKLRLKLFLEETRGQDDSLDTQTSDEDTILEANHIVDVFPHTTVLFADIVGFTAWASEREPTLILTLLHNIFDAFDRIAKRRGVFKVESVGDSYVAVTGFPDSQPDHAVRMTRFAIECMEKMQEVTKKLEPRLGPSTGDLRMRFGLNSGPVTAGVLSGDKNARIQLFGDTMNTAERMESNGEQNRIHLSESTALCLKEAGKARWIQPREEKITAKGKGEMQTYWVRRKRAKPNKSPLDPQVENGAVGEESVKSVMSIPLSGNSDLWGGEENDLPDTAMEDKNARLVEWHVDSLTGLLKKIVAQREVIKKVSKKSEKSVNIDETLDKSGTPLDEVREIISLPRFDDHTAKKVASLENVTISTDAVNQLRDFVTQIANFYHSNPFHNFEHASHVTMAVHKLLSRIITPENVDYQRKNVSKVKSDLHDYTFGITSDPLTHFAVVLSALIHDVDHRGVSNGQLATEMPRLADTYRNQSLAEQNSVDLAWGLLMDPRYSDLQACIFTNQTELLRFRQIVVQTVLATDIFDPDLKLLRNMRWDKAFHSDKLTSTETASSFSMSLESEDGSYDDVKWKDTNRKATIVIEHIIQASDVAHTMQHWHVYKKWNQQLFRESYEAWKKGRAPKDPSVGWYEGELWFFDKYVIPLAQKLDECGVFGVASDECLHHALSNRNEWEAKGKGVLKEMIEDCQHGDDA